MKIKRITRIKSDSKRYDIKTECGNFFANNILVHNCTIYKDYVHARSLDSQNHPSRNWVKAFASEFQYQIPKGWRLCGENLYARHSIEYNNLKGYFYGFSIYNEENICLSWDETFQWFVFHKIPSPKIIHDGAFGEDHLKFLVDTVEKEGHEGYVIRNADSFHYDDFNKNVAKYVRKNHVQTNEHWMHSKIVPNKLMEK